MIYVVKPVVLGAIHALIYEQNILQLSLLASVELLSFGVVCNYQIRYKVFKIKTLFFCEGLSQLSTAFLNCLLALQITLTGKYCDLEPLVEVTLRWTVLFICLLVSLIILQTILSSFQNLIKYFKNNEDR